MKLSDFHKFYNDVNAARSNFLRNLVRGESPHFIEINCDAIECDDHIPADSVKTEADGGDVVKVESELPRDDTIDNEAPGNHSASEAEDFFDDADHTDEGHVNFSEELGVKCRLGGDELASAESATAKLVATNTSMASAKFEEDKFDKLAANYMDMACELCKNPFKKLAEMRKHYRVKHKQRNVWMKCCQKRLDLYDVIEHIQYHLNPQIFK